MDFKLAFALVAAFAIAQVTCKLSPEAEHAQYAVVKFATEATIFRMRAYSLALEMNYTVKVKDQEIIALMTTMGLDAAIIDGVKNEMMAKSTSINDNILRIMESTATLIDTLNAINNDIVNNPANLQLGLYKMNSEVNTVNLSYELGSQNVVLSIEIVKIRIDNAIAGSAAPEATEIQTLVADAETVLLQEHAALTASKVVFDSAHAMANTTLQALIDSQPVFHF